MTGEGSALSPQPGIVSDAMFATDQDGIKNFDRIGGPVCLFQERSLGKAVVDLTANMIVSDLSTRIWRLPLWKFACLVESRGPSLPLLIVRQFAQSTRDMRPTLSERFGPATHSTAPAIGAP